MLHTRSRSESSDLIYLVFLSFFRLSQRDEIDSVRQSVVMRIKIRMSESGPESDTGEGVGSKSPED